MLWTVGLFVRVVNEAPKGYRDEPPARIRPPNGWWSLALKANIGQASISIHSPGRIMLSRQLLSGILISLVDGHTEYAYIPNQRGQVR